MTISEPLARFEIRTLLAVRHRQVLAANLLLCVLATAGGCVTAIASNAVYPITAASELPSWHRAAQDLITILQSNLLVIFWFCLGLPCFGISGMLLLAVQAFRFGFYCAAWSAMGIGPVLPVILGHGPLELLALVLANTGVQYLSLGVMNKLVSGVPTHPRTALRYFAGALLIILVAAVLEVALMALRMAGVFQ